MAASHQVKTEATTAKYGLIPEDLENTNAPRLKVKVYQPEEAVFGKDMSSSVVFRGTGMTSGEDWKNNAYQGMGGSLRPIVRGDWKKIKDSAQPIDCTGGGLASVCSRFSGRPGWTFNAAELNRGK